MIYLNYLIKRSLWARLSEKMKFLGPKTIVSDQDSEINDFSKAKLWHKTISPHSMLIWWISDFIPKKSKIFEFWKILFIVRFSMRKEPCAENLSYAVERGLARVSDSTSTDRTTGHTISYCTVFFRIQHRIVQGKNPRSHENESEAPEAELKGKHKKNGLPLTEINMNGDVMKIPRADFTPEPVWRNK